MPVGRTPPRRASRGSGAGYGKREKRAVVPFTPDDKKPTKRQKAAGGRGGRSGRVGRGGRGGKPGKDDALVNKYQQAKNRINSQLSAIRQQLAMIEAYDMDGWKGASREKLRPTAEIAKAKVKIFNCKLKVREMFKELDYPPAHKNAKRIEKMPTLDSDDGGNAFDDNNSDPGIDCEDISCATCGAGEADDDDDILLCDGFCDGAYHMSCLDPVVTVKDLSQQNEDDDWMCHVCDARVDAYYALNAVLEYHIDAGKASHLDVFPEAFLLDEKKQGPGQVNDLTKDKKGNDLMAEEWASDESDDSDFGGDKVSDDGRDDDDEPLSGSGRDSDDDSESDMSSPEVILGKRKRTKVDYCKLNDEMFGGKEAFAGEAEDEKKGGWGSVASPSKKAKKNMTKKATKESPKSPKKTPRTKETKTPTKRTQKTLTKLPKKKTPLRTLSRKSTRK